MGMAGGIFGLLWKGWRMKREIKKGQFGQFAFWLQNCTGSQEPYISVGIRDFRIGLEIPKVIAR